jgi:hypothetical protein
LNATARRIDSRKQCESLFADVAPVEDFNLKNRTRDNVKYQQSVGWFQVDAAMARTVASFGLWLRIERRAKIFSTSAAIYDHRVRYMRRQLKLPLLLEKKFEFAS